MIFFDTNSLKYKTLPAEKRKKGAIRTHAIGEYREGANAYNTLKIEKPEEENIKALFLCLCVSLSSLYWRIIENDSVAQFLR